MSITDRAPPNLCNIILEERRGKDDTRDEDFKGTAPPSSPVVQEMLSLSTVLPVTVKK